PAPLLAPLPRPAYARARPEDRERAARAAARGRNLGDLVRGPRGPVDHDRGVRGAEAGRSRSGHRCARLHQGRGRRLSCARLHEVLPGAPGTLALAVDRANAAGGDPAAAGRAVLGLQLLVLGAADGRAALGRSGPPAGASGGDRPSRDRRPPWADEAAAPAGTDPPRRLRDRRALGP